MKVWTPDEAYARMADACARAEYCTGELRERMRRHGVSADDADAITRRLVEGRFVDDVRYARSFVRSKSVGARWGRRKIAAALAAKRIPRGIIADALAEIDGEAYAESLRGLLAAKVRMLGAGTLESYEGRTRLFRFAASRGYETEAIAAALRRLMQAQNV